MAGGSVTAWRSMIKKTVERAALGAGVARRARVRHHDRVVVLAYHNVVTGGAPPAGDLSLHLPLSSFREQLDFLQQTYDVVPLERMHEPTGPGRPRAVVTFDDAYRGAIALGLPELAQRGLPATVFVCPGRLGAGAFWWDRLADDRGHGLDAATRARALEELQGREDLIERALPSTSELGDHYFPVDAPELAGASAQEGITFASHTWSHPNLAKVPHDVLVDELRRSRQWIQEECPGACLPDDLSFPYGLFDERVVEAASEAGYRRCYRVEGGLTPPLVERGDGRPALVPRVNIPAGVSLGGFELRLAGVMS
jgi:peptidoglycan/xylan/chitin deacetylase (PgdA/CDA1 family)